MKSVLIAMYCSVIGLNAFNIANTDKVLTEIKTNRSFTLLNDTKEKVSIYTGTGFVSLNKGSKTSIGCNIGIEVKWANEGKKGNLIFKITKEMCGETIKLSQYVK